MRRITCAVVIAAALSGVFGATSARGAAAELEYEVRLGGFPAGIVRLSVEFDAERYRMTAHTQSRGLVDLLIGFRSFARSEGARGPEALLPELHSAENRWRGEPRRVRLEYDGAGEVEATVAPPAEHDDRDPVPAGLTKGTLDPLSAALSAALSAEAGRPCEGRLDIFDGRRRYAIHFEGRSRDGEALRCRLRLERIAGMSHDPWLPILEPIEVAELWLAPLRPDLPPTPVRLTAETAFGAAIVRLVALDGAPP